MSILAGFVEPGESAEQAVAREVAEETGITVGEIRYLGSQPWPMPQSLMLGFWAAADGDQPIHVDEDEIAEAHWFSRDELRAAMAAGEICCPRRSRSPTGSSKPGTATSCPPSGDGQAGRGPPARHSSGD